MAEKYRGLELAPSSRGPGRLAGLAAEVVGEYREAMDRFALHEAAFAAFRLVDAVNEFIQESAPWVLARDPARADDLSHVLYDAAEAVRVAALLLLPVMPTASAEILRRCGERRPVADLRLDRDGVWRADVARTLVKGPNLWPRLEGTAQPSSAATSTESRVSDTHDWKPNAPAPEAPVTLDEAVASSIASEPPAPSAAAGDERIPIDEFMKVQLKVAKVLTAERVPKSKKLVKMWVDLGAEQRTIVAGIAEAYEPESLVGRTIVIVANLKPAKLMGIESNGMVLAASADDGRPMLLTVDGEAVPGMKVK
jgi:methionyl-tRNA synthetase